MNPPAITITINGTSYSLSADNPEAIRSMPDADRQQLIALLEVVKQQQQPVTPASTEASSTAYNVGSPITPQTKRTERLGSGDVDTLVAQLMAEEKAKSKPGLTQGDIYKWVGGIAIAIILLMLLL